MSYILGSVKALVELETWFSASLTNKLPARLLEFQAFLPCLTMNFSRKRLEAKSRLDKY